MEVLILNRYYYYYYYYYYYDVIFTALGGEHKAEQNRCRGLGVLPKFHSKAFLKIHEYLSADDFEGKKRLNGV